MKFISFIIASTSTSTALAAPNVQPRVDIPGVNITLVSDTITHQEQFTGLWVSDVTSGDQGDRDNILCTTRYNQIVKSKDIPFGGDDAFTPVIPVHGLSCSYKNTLFRNCS
ncbi:hypothetical protein CEP54_011690 [Fusarium duplospermum]|uniref:Uncharacterized protein n=1 Tax=Fusarium duplospermum TaxID=1325734 RepID=A0A428PD59_9HYPO|nr:hypothetical protein CEP54_011690 [Fusarium duplospermum]